MWNIVQESEASIKHVIRSCNLMLNGQWEVIIWNVVTDQILDAVNEFIQNSIRKIRITSFLEIQSKEHLIMVTLFE